MSILKKKAHKVSIQFACTYPNMPSEQTLIDWANKVLSDSEFDQEMTIRIVSSTEIQALNATYRHQDKPTNVLAFPMALEAEFGMHLLGDILICAEVVTNEAQQQHKTLEAHWAHMVIHGTLHLLGYDHIDPIEADEMEACEIALLADLGYDNPYVIKGE